MPSTWERSVCISIHAPRTGSDLLCRIELALVKHFNPRSPHGERHQSCHICNGQQHFNPRSPHGERPRERVTPPNAKGISIHAPRTGSDPANVARRRARNYFNPRSPHGERLNFYDTVIRDFQFQSTLPARGATVNCSISVLSEKYFNPRSPHGERPVSFSSTSCARH